MYLPCTWLVLARVLGTVARSTDHSVDAARAKLRVGRRFTVSVGEKYTPALVRLDANKVVLCYTDGSESMHGVCQVLGASADTILEGNSLVVNEAPTYFPAIARLGPGRALLCYRDNLKERSGNCNVLIAEGIRLANGPEITVKFGPMNKPTLAQLGNDKAVLCYPDVEHTESGKCSVITASGTDITRSEETRISAGPSHRPVLAPLSDDKAMLCYSGEAYGHCNVLKSSGSTLETGDDLVFDALPTFYPILTRFDDNRMVVCYTDISAPNTVACHALSISGMVITKGEMLVTSSGCMSYPTLTTLGEHTCVLCHANDLPATDGMCHVLTLSDTRLFREDAVAIDTAPYQPATAQLDTGSVMLCYIADSAAYCRLVTSPSAAATGRAR